jgi:alpha-glucosidase
MVGERPGDLVMNNDLMLNLNDSSKIKDVSWIQPGKIMRVMTQTTKDAFENIDFAAKHGLQYIFVRLEMVWSRIYFYFQMLLK